MTSIEITILKINQRLISAFAMLDSWLDRGDLAQKLADGETVLDQIEHILFENQIFLKEIQQSVNDANILYRKGMYKPGRYTLSIDNIVPQGRLQRRVTRVSADLQSAPETLRLLLRDQLYRSMTCLDQLSHGQGRLVDVTLVLDEPVKMDPYQALYFVALYMRRRINTLTDIYSAMDACSTH